MSYGRKSIALASAAVLVTAFICIAAAGCISSRQYRQPGLGPNGNIERTEGYTLGLIELDDQGWLWNADQIDTLLTEFHAEQSSNGLFIVTFVHGWMHNASDRDENLRSFKSKILQPIARMEQFVSLKEHRQARRIVGVYVAWRGLSSVIPGLKYLTFWDRKAAAERIGRGAVTELLCELEQLRNQGNPKDQGSINSPSRVGSRLLIIGHSFGADIVYSAISPILINRLVELDNNGAQRSSQTIGDLVVLVNPAFEAARFETLHRLGEKAGISAGKHCTLAVFTSESDIATKYAFPAGRWLSALSQSHRDPTERTANKQAIGHYRPYLNFELVRNNERARANDSDPSERVIQLNALLARENLSSAQFLTQSFTFTHCTLHSTSNYVASDPVFVASVDPLIVPDHSSIDRGIFTRFLVEFLYAFSETNMAQSGGGD